MKITSEMTPEKVEKMMHDCTLCPRRCHADRVNGQTGFCRESAVPRAARAALHYWEEPCISGDRGSGAVFFSGCNLGCVYCQNYDISVNNQGRSVSVSHLARIFIRLQEKGAANINLVTACHFLPQVCLALKEAKELGLSVPVVYNSSGYEETHSLRLLEGLVDIYLPDLKYFSSQPAASYSKAPDYFEKASSAIGEMFRQAGKPVFSPESGLMKRGVIVRHLLLPGQAPDSKRILRYLHETYGNDIYVSIMNQYTPLKQVSQIPGLNRRISSEEYNRILDFADKIGIENGYVQEGGTAEESFIPAFNGEGLL